MIAKTSYICCFVAKTNLSRSTHFLIQQMSPFNPFRRGGRRKGTMSPFFYHFFAGLPLALDFLLTEQQQQQEEESRILGVRMSFPHFL